MNFELSKDELVLVLAGLNELPRKQSDGLFRKLQFQFAACQQAEQEQPEEQDADAAETD